MAARSGEEVRVMIRKEGTLNRSNEPAPNLLSSLTGAVYDPSYLVCLRKRQIRLIGELNDAPP
ncbi:hypothetical protein E2562_012512 [Oryza meyeriana var. granulata]|uniref:Uncharacterized protein n=1 Tax=Oryza meyeriana var. granulata TaxID=110450 RepID=A0A6G1BW72_9ORYZ|nr:hypothetical protein E2562_012512 [Oryza meyeriana var. granulata]